METYTDFELRTEMETRTVPETYTEWKTVYESVLDIPNYEYYNCSIDDYNIKIYKTNEDNRVKYFFQNASYFEATDKDEGFFGERDIKILLIDTNSNGNYLDDDDRVLFNVWNPYEINSSYKEIPVYMSNYWYRQRELKN